MVVLITNLTDAPGKKPTQVDIYNKTLDPGSNIKLPADLVNQKIRALETSGLIAIGSLPPWYVAAKTKKGRPLSSEEKAKMQVAPPAPAPALKVVEKTEPKKDKKEKVSAEEFMREEQLKQSTKG